MIACEACDTPLLTTGRDCCQLLSLSPTGTQFVWLSQGRSPLRAAPVLFALFPQLLEHSLCHPAMTGATEAIHSQSTSQTEHMCPVQVPIQENFP